MPGPPIKPSPKTRSTKKGTGAATGTTLASAGVVWLLGKVHVKLNAEEGALIAGGLTTAVLFVWHYGVRNILRHLIGGDSPDELKSDDDAARGGGG
jgi:hypothetical protein